VRGEPFILLGDAVWLDLVNTARGRVADPPDGLPDLDAWTAWTSALQLPASSDISLEQVHALRRHLTGLATALAASQPSPSASMRAVNDLLLTSPGHQRLVRVAGHWQLSFAPVAPASVLPLIARSVAETLSLPLATVRLCAGPTCNLFILDRSSTQIRRWCSLDHCGRGMRVERRRAAHGG
jgi:predicted RNA-binding Zn ribbon-like protein